MALKNVGKEKPKHKNAEISRKCPPCLGISPRPWTPSTNLTPPGQLTLFCTFTFLFSFFFNTFFLCFFHFISYTFYKFLSFLFSISFLRLFDTFFICSFISCHPHFFFSVFFCLYTYFRIFFSLSPFLERGQASFSHSFFFVWFLLLFLELIHTCRHGRAT